MLDTALIRRNVSYDQIMEAFKDRLLSPLTSSIRLGAPEGKINGSRLKYRFAGKYPHKVLSWPLTHGSKLFDSEAEFYLQFLILEV